jgi:hypothetical protein
MAKPKADTSESTRQELTYMSLLSRAADRDAAAKPHREGGQSGGARDMQG